MKKFIKNIFEIGMPVLVGVLSRIMPHPANVTAVGGLAIFSGANYGKTKALFLTVATMAVSDIFLGFHPTMWATYGSLAISVLLANYFLKKKKKILSIGIITFINAIIFFLITNFAVWIIYGSMYPRTFAGLLDSYVMALPFFRNSLLGDFFYTGIFFGVYFFIKNFKLLQRYVA